MLCDVTFDLLTQEVCFVVKLHTESLKMKLIAGIFQIFIYLCYVMLPLIWPFDLTYFKSMVNLCILFKNRKLSVFRGCRNEILGAIGLKAP